MSELTLPSLALEFIESELGSGLQTVKLQGDASTRQYFRVSKDNSSRILMVYPSQENSGSDFLAIQKLLIEHQVQTPKIYSSDLTQGFILLEDLGDISLEDYKKSESDYMDLYEDSIIQLSKLHRINPYIDHPSTKNKFDKEKLFWELNHALENLNEFYQVTFSDSKKTSLLNEFSLLSKQLADSVSVICHRDFHSRNIMIKNKKAFFIDFQDARLGTQAYDVASLACDSYVDLSSDERDHVIDFYLQTNGIKKDSEWTSSYARQKIQRTLKACGSFSSFYNLRNEERYLQYLPVCLKMLMTEPFLNEYLEIKEYVQTLYSRESL